ncbi:hypothetical protein ACI2KR_09130 [Pseudomonas luteola]
MTQPLKNRGLTMHSQLMPNGEEMAVVDEGIIKSALAQMQSEAHRGLSESGYKYIKGMLTVGYSRAGNVLKPSYFPSGQDCQTVMILGDGISVDGHHKRVGQIVKQASELGWPVICADFESKDLRLYQSLMLAAKDAMREEDLLPKWTPTLQNSDVFLNVAQRLEAMDVTGTRIWKLMGLICRYVETIGPIKVTAWMAYFNTLDKVLGLLQTSFAKRTPEFKDVLLKQFCKVEAEADIQSEHYQHYLHAYMNIIYPFLECMNVCAINNKSNVGVSEAVSHRKLLYCDINPEFGKNNGISFPLEAFKAHLQCLVRASTGKQPLVVFRVSGPRFKQQSTHILEMVKSIRSSGAYVLILIDHVTQDTLYLAIRLQSMGIMDVVLQDSSLTHTLTTGKPLIGGQGFLMSARTLTAPLLLEAAG